MTDTKTIMVLLEHGEIIISDVLYNVDRVGFMTLINPAVVIHERPHTGSLGFMLTPWIPTELTADSRIELSISVIKGTLIPSPELLSFYRAWAHTERDKWKHFGKEFSQQVTDIEKLLTQRYSEAKFRRVSDSAAASSDSELLSNLFDAEEPNWGNNSTTH